MKTMTLFNKNPLLSNQLSVIMSKLGMNEQYISFQYLHSIFLFLFTIGESKSNYHHAIKNIKESFNITTRTIHYGINQQLNLISIKNFYDCNNENLFNKIKHLKTYIEKSYL